MTEIIGSNWNDVLSGTAADDIIRGLDGDDRIFGGEGGNDLLEGGSGDDLLIGRAASELRGGLDDDELIGQDAAQLFGEEGNDILRNQAGAISGSATPLLDGGAGDDYLEYYAVTTGQAGLILGGSGHDEFFIFQTAAQVDAGADSDLVTLSVAAGAFDVRLGSGQDLLRPQIQGTLLVTAAIRVADFEVGDAGDSVLLGGFLTMATGFWDRVENPFEAGFLKLFQRGADAVIQYDRNPDDANNPAVDLLVLQNVQASSLTAHNLGFEPDGGAGDGEQTLGTAGRDLIAGAAGIDFIDGAGGDDILFGGAEQDRLGGGEGDDQLDGELGNDIVFGEGGDDRISDVLGGSDRLVGGDGNDEIFLDRFGQIQYPSGGFIDIDGGAGDDNIRYNSLLNNDRVKVFAGEDNDRIGVGPHTQLEVDAGTGADEVIFAVTGSQTTITLGTGSDLVVPYFAPNSSLTSFTILDFDATAGFDRFDLVTFVTFGAWISTTNPFADGVLKIGQFGADTHLLIDTNGGGDNFRLLGTLENVDAHLLNLANLGYDPGLIAIYGSNLDDALTGTAVAEELRGLAGSDVLFGRGGGDRLFGEAGADTFLYRAVEDSAGASVDTIVAFESGVDRIDLRSLPALSVSWTTSGATRIVTVDTLLGAMTINVDGPVAAGDFLLPTGLIQGTDANDRLEGGAADNLIDGRAGADEMIGAAGNDSYVVDNAGDLVVEAAGGGTDAVYARIAVTLADQVEKLFLTGAVASGTGNDLANAITGNAATNLLDGRGGADLLSGLGGNDTYVVDQAGDLVVEGAGGGNDRILAGASYVLRAGVQVETLATTSDAGTASINLLGNELANILVGNAGANILNGGGGADVMRGLGGNDQYYVDQAADQVVEAAGGGTDRILASVSYVLGAGVQVETLSTTSNGGTSAINFGGNELANALLGNAGANTLNGGVGADVLSGFAGNDVYYVDNAADQVYELTGNGTDRIFTSASYALRGGSFVETISTTNTAGTDAINLGGNETANALLGNAGNNILNGGGGADTLSGYGGNDQYYVDNALDQVYEAAGGGTDRIFASASYTLRAGSAVETISTTNAALASAINLGGNAFVNTIFGNAGANILNGGGGADILSGFAGNDSYHVDNAGDQVFEAAGGGTDRIFASVDYALASGVQVETLSTDNNAGTAAIDLTGNALANTLFGNAGANVLDGSAGADTMSGLGGADTFRFATALGGGNVDRIGDFAAGVDEIAIDNAVFTGLAAGALAAGAFRTGAAAADADDRIIYNSATGALFFDADGVGGAAAIQFATLGTGLALSAGDFVVI